METKFNKLYNIIKEEFQFDPERNEKYWYLLRQIRTAPSNKDLEYIYKQNKEFIDGNENLTLALISNGNAIHLFKNQFRDSPYKRVQDWFNVQDEEYPSNYMSDEDWDTWNDLTKGEAEDIKFY